jgi:hypothetical protein
MVIAQTTRQRPPCPIAPLHPTQIKHTRIRPVYRPDVSYHPLVPHLRKQVCRPGYGELKGRDNRCRYRSGKADPGRYNSAVTKPRRATRDDVDVFCMRRKDECASKKLGETVVVAKNNNQCVLCTAEVVSFSWRACVMTVEPRDGRISSELYSITLESSRSDSSLHFVSLRWMV